MSAQAGADVPALIRELRDTKALLKISEDTVSVVVIQQRKLVESVLKEEKVQKAALRESKEANSASQKEIVYLREEIENLKKDESKCRTSHLEAENARLEAEMANLQHAHASAKDECASLAAALGAEKNKTSRLRQQLIRRELEFRELRAANRKSLLERKEALAQNEMSTQRCASLYGMLMKEMEEKHKDNPTVRDEILKALREAYEEQGPSDKSTSE